MNHDDREELNQLLPLFPPLLMSNPYVYTKRQCYETWGANLLI